MDLDFDTEETSAPEDRPSGQAPRRPRKIRRSDEAQPAGPVTVDGADFFQPRPQ